MRTALDFLETLTLAAASTDYKLTNGLPNDYAMWGLILDLKFRVVVGTHAVATPFLGAPFTLLERIQVQGQVPGVGQINVIDLSGRQLMQLVRTCGGRQPYLDPDNFIVGAGAIATYDIRLQLPVPFVALGTGYKSVQATLLPGNIFSNPLSVVIRRGSANALAETDTGSTQTFSTYGAGTGSPTVDIHRVLVKQGPGKANPSVLLVAQKTKQGPFATASGLTNGQIARLNTGNLIGRILLVNGVPSTVATGELATGTDANISRIYLMQNTTAIRNQQWKTGHLFNHFMRGPDSMSGIYLTAQGLAGGTGGYSPCEMPGEHMIDFVQHGNIADGLNTIGWQPNGKSLILNGDVTALSNAVVEVITEEYVRVG